MKDTPKFFVAIFVLCATLLGLFIMPTITDFALGRRDLPPPGYISDKSTLESFPFDLWSQVLGAYVDDDGRVNYPGIAEDPGFLVFIDTLSRVAPETHPEFFPDTNARLSYYINAYNAFTIYGVVKHPGIASVQKVLVKSLAKLEDGQGFFYSLRFKMGKRWINLYDLENKIIRGFGDARIHAAINCASTSCPTLRNQAYMPEQLDKHLEEAMVAMLTDPRHLQVDMDAREVRASEIFNWFQEDFSATTPEGLYAYWKPFANEPTLKALEAAESNQFQITWIPYDWSLNGPPVEVKEDSEIPGLKRMR